MGEINIKSILSETKQYKLREAIGCSLHRVIVGGDYAIKGVLGKNTFIGNQVSMSFNSRKGKQHLISIFSSLEEKDIYGEYDRMFVKVHELEDQPFSEDKEILLRNRGLLFLEIPKLFILKSIDLYGVKVEGYLDHDDDFPKEDTVINADIDLLLKMNGESNEFIVCYLKSGKTQFEWHTDSECFDAFIKNSRDHWGDLGALSYKYSLSL